MKLTQSSILKKLAVCFSFLVSAALFQNLSPADPFYNPTLKLASFGALGDGQKDDTAALKKAIAAATTYCLDGENKTYLVTGMLSSTHSLCLKNAVIVQMMTPVDTSPYIKSYRSHQLPLLTAFEFRSYSEDPVLSDSQNAELKLRMNLRTLYIRGDAQTTQLVLSNIKIKKGRYEDLGNGNEAAAIYITSVPTVTISNLEISGKGQGTGLLVTGASKRVRIDHLNIHDIHWKLPKGSPELSMNEMRDKWQWNNVPIYTYKADLKKFIVVRSQERASGLVISKCYDVEIANSRVSEMLYIVNGVGIPWQADGISVGHSNKVKIHDTSVNQSWEGIDITGGEGPGEGVSNFQVDRVQLENNFNYGLKVVHGASNGWVRGIKIRNSGQYGVVVAGPVHDVVLSGLVIAGFGTLQLRDGFNFRPGLNVPTAAVGVQTYGVTDRAENPEHVRIVDSRFVSDSSSGIPDFGIFVDHPEFMTHVVAGANVISGYRTASASGLMTTSYTYEEVRRAFTQLLGCEGSLKSRISAWDQSSNSVRNPVWQIYDMQNFVKTAGTCK
jgi:hypothetical protein